MKLVMDLKTLKLQTFGNFRKWLPWRNQLCKTLHRGYNQNQVSEIRSTDIAFTPVKNEDKFLGHQRYLGKYKKNPVWEIRLVDYLVTRAAHLHDFLAKDR